MAYRTISVINQGSRIRTGGESTDPSFSEFTKLLTRLSKPIMQLCDFDTQTQTT